MSGRALSEVLSEVRPEDRHEVRLLRDLVATPSVSGTERVVASLFAERAEGLGFTAEVDGANNAVCVRGAEVSESRVHVVLLGHLDTVAGEIPVRIQEGVLHGRGSVDAKGPAAALLVAGSRVELPPGVRLTVVGAAGEETAESPGARHLLERWGSHRPDACVIGEPSGWDGVTLGYKGRLICEARVERDHAHSAGANPSAADELFGWWVRIMGACGPLNAGARREFDRVHASLRDINATCDGLRQVATATAGFRLPPTLTPSGMEDMLRGAASASPGDVDFVLRCWGPEEPLIADRGNAVARALSMGVRAVGGRPRPKLKTGTSDMNVVGPVWGCPIAAYGPGDSSLDHTPVERQDLGEYLRSIEVLTHGLTMLVAELSEERAGAALAGAEGGSR